MGHFKCIVHSRLKVTFAVILENSLNFPGLEQDSDFLSSRINNGLFKTRTQRGWGIQIYMVIHYLFLVKVILYPKNDLELLT